MPHIDYMKLLHIAANTLETSTQVDLNTLDINYYKAVLSRADRSNFEMLVRVHEFEIELAFSNKILTKKEMQKWLPKFEFQLEQNFLKNIEITQTESNNEYKLRIQF